MAKSKTDTDTGDQVDVAELRRQLDAANAEKETYRAQASTETQRRREAEKANMGAQERALVSELESSESRLESLEGDLNSMEEQIARLADEPGQGKEVAKLNRRMAEAAAEQRDLKNRKTWLESQRERLKKPAPTDNAPTEGARLMPNGYPFDNFDPQTKAWLEKHPRAFTDAVYYDKCIAAAQSATRLEGIPDRSPEYFAFIETKLGERQVENTDEVDEEEDEGEEVQTPQTEERYTPERPQPRAAGPGSGAAPPSRQVPSGGGGGNRRMPALTAQEKEVALSLYSHVPGLSDADKLKRYADNRKYMKERNPQHFQGYN